MNVFNVVNADTHIDHIKHIHHTKSILSRDHWHIKLAIEYISGHYNALHF